MVRGSVENARYVADTHASVMLAVHLDHRRDRAVEGAVEGLERDIAADGGLQRLEEIEPAADPARHAGADAHEPLAWLREAEFRVVRGDPVRFGERHAQMRGDLA